MKITLEIPEKDIQQALNHGFEHAPWLKGGNVNAVEPWIQLREDTDYKPRATDLEHARMWGDSRVYLDVERGLQMMYQRETHTDGAAIGRGQPPRYWDANQADCFVQYAAFGKLVYG